MYSRSRELSKSDADSALYGGFISNEDRKLCNQVLTSSPEKLSTWVPDFKSTRLQALYPRYRARNWPETLSTDEQQKWKQFCQARLIDGEYDCPLTTMQFQQRLEELALEDLSERDHKALGDLVTWGSRFYLIKTGKPVNPLKDIPPPFDMFFKIIIKIVQILSFGTVLSALFSRYNRAPMSLLISNCIYQKSALKKDAA